MDIQAAIDLDVGWCAQCQLHFVVVFGVAITEYPVEHLDLVVNTLESRQSLARIPHDVTASFSLLFISSKCIDCD